MTESTTESKQPSTDLSEECCCLSEQVGCLDCPEHEVDWQDGVVAGWCLDHDPRVSSLGVGGLTQAEINLVEQGVGR